MNLQNPAAFIDHTLLRADATRQEILHLCEEAVEFGFAAVCIPPCYVRDAAKAVYGSGVAVATVIGFPLGYATSASKAFEAQDAVGLGATEIDMVISLGAAREGRLDVVEQDIRQVVEATSGAMVKVILETAHWDAPKQIELTQRVIAAGAHYVKTSTGFGPRGASLADVQTLASVAAGKIGVKAAGGIRDWEFCRTLISAGATRIGTSAGVAIMREWQTQEEGFSR